VREVERVSAALARTDAYGVYHCTSQGETSWADFARFAAAALGCRRRDVEALPTAAIAMKEPRPRRSILDNRMLRARGLDGSVEPGRRGARLHRRRRHRPAANDRVPR